ncbi:uncharacterized protein LOC113303384 [Papaver somniferum]|uniref:uncharacterized protein LOC113303384 n=1 Tax=Papaver somniferum TaxID=3469 RepID=UPI000E6FC536|nr:uncharacterized protein LOC113303384 [Papaver somniferum]
MYLFIMSIRSESSSSQLDPLVKRVRPDSCNNSPIRVTRVKNIIPRYPVGACVTIIDEDDLVTPFSSSLILPTAADLENVDLGISCHEYPNAGLSFATRVRCLSSNYRNVGGFLGQKEFVTLYTKIWRIYGHIATRSVVQYCSSALVSTVNCLLPMVAEVESMSIRVVAEPTIQKWEKMVSTCESLKFNISWLRRRLNIVKVDRAGILAGVVPATKAIMEEKKSLAMESHKVEESIRNLKSMTERYQSRLKMMLSRDYNLLDRLFCVM